MDPEQIAKILSYIYTALGGLLIVLEFFLPGLVIVFFGIGSLITALLLWTGVIENVLTSVGMFFGSSLFLALTLRWLVVKMFPGDKDSYKSEDDNLNALGNIVEVIDTVYEDNANGRIRFQGTTWPASSIEGIIKAGQRAKIVSNDNIGWIVEACDADEPEDRLTM